MIDLNNCSFTGRLTADATIKTLPTGSRLCEASMANNKGLGENAKTLFLTLKIWGKYGDTMCQYLTKGKAVAVCGELEQDEWTSQQDGQTRKKLVLQVNKIALLGGGQVNGNVKEVEIEVVDEQENITF